MEPQTAHELLLSNAHSENENFINHLNAQYWVYFSTHFEKNKGVDFDKQDFGQFNDDFSGHALRHVFYQDAIMMLEALDEENPAIPVLVQEARPLAQLYDEWCSNDYTAQDAIQCTMEELAEKLEKARQNEVQRTEEKADAAKSPRAASSKRHLPYEPGGR